MHNPFRNVTPLLGLLCLVFRIGTGWAEERLPLPIGEWREPQGGLRVELLAPQNGGGLSIDTPAKGFLYTAAGQLPPTMADTFSLSLRVDVPEQDGLPLVFEVKCYEPGGASFFWKKVELQEVGSHVIELPLRDFRRTGARLPRWERVSQLGLYFRTPGRLQVREFSLRRVDGSAAVYSVDAVKELAFPGKTEKEIRVLPLGSGWMMTDLTEQNWDPLLDLLRRLDAKMEKDLPFLLKDAPPAFLIIYAQETDYVKFFERLGARYGASIVPPRSGGYSVTEFAVSSYDPQKGPTRPVFLHEYVHAVLSAKAFLGEGNWLQEGLANLYQVEFLPQDNWAEVVAKSLEIPQAQTPLRQLLSGRRVELKQYWQMVVVMRMLLREERFAPQLEPLIRMLLEKGTLDVGVAIGPLYGMTWEEMEEAWREHARTWVGELRSTSRRNLGDGAEGTPE